MSEQAQAHAVTQAEAFEALMIDIWEGGPAYDLTFRDGKRANNALDMLGALFPDAILGEPHVEGDEEPAIFVTFPDGSKGKFLASGNGTNLE